MIGNSFKNINQNIANELENQIEKLKFDVGREHKDLQDYLKRLKGLDSKQMRFEAERSLEKLRVELNKRNNSYDIYNDKLLELYMGIGKYNKINHLTNTFNTANYLDYEKTKKINHDYISYDKDMLMNKNNTLNSYSSNHFVNKDNDNNNLGISSIGNNEHFLKNETELIYINEDNNLNKNENSSYVTISNNNVIPKLDSESVFMTNFQSNSLANSTINNNKNAKKDLEESNQNSNHNYNDLLNDLNSIKKLNSNINKRGLELKGNIMNTYNDNHMNVDQKEYLKIESSNNKQNITSTDNNEFKKEIPKVEININKNNEAEENSNNRKHDEEEIKKNDIIENKNIDTNENNKENVISVVNNNDMNDMKNDNDKEIVKDKDKLKSNEESKDDGGSSKKYLFTGESNKSIK